MISFLKKIIDFLLIIWHTYCVIYSIVTVKIFKNLQRMGIDQLGKSSDHLFQSENMVERGWMRLPSYYPYNTYGLKELPLLSFIYRERSKHWAMLVWLKNKTNRNYNHVYSIQNLYLMASFYPIKSNHD